VIIGTGVFVLTLVVSGMQNYADLNPDAPLAEAFNSVGLPVFANIISLGAVAGVVVTIFSPVLPALAVLACLFLMLNLTGETWLRFAIWMLVGFVVYFAYSARHSRLAPGGDHTPVQDTATSRTESPRTA